MGIKVITVVDHFFTSWLRVRLVELLRHKVLLEKAVVRFESREAINLPGLIWHRGRFGHWHNESPRDARRRELSEDLESGGLQWAWPQPDLLVHWHPELLLLYLS